MDVSGKGQKQPAAGPKRNRKQTGALGEQAAAELLAREGYEILARNWRCRSGELDIIAFKDHQFIFVEVRTRSAGALMFGNPAESVDARKIKQVRDTAAVYLYQQGKGDAAVRFDVVAVIVNKAGQAVTADHLIGAF
ncbi:YraN family protein [Paenibacillus pinistramenti]|uniref:YraN family protein n=1 Tax=Paenibacillus pinistramenti TaxID=1768003 RepID=UPI0011095BE4|nr:YraN family protein [Paenibacillus pinistramenti]